MDGKVDPNSLSEGVEERKCVWEGEGDKVRMGSSFARMVRETGADEKMPKVRWYIPGTSQPMCVAPFSHWG